jgi:hypothetical protein
VAVRRVRYALVNWVNPSRDFDTALRERAALLRTETLGRVGATQFLEEAAPEEALRRYRLALDDVRLYCRWPVERGLLGELQEPDQPGEPLVLDRMTRRARPRARGSGAAANVPPRGHCSSVRVRCRAGHGRGAC